MAPSSDGPASYGSDWSVGACQIEGCRFCTDGWTGTCQRCDGRKTHQPMWSHEPDGWQVDVCPTCGYAIEPTGFGGFMQLAYHTRPDGKGGEIDHPDNLAMRILKGLEIVDDHPVLYCAVESCRQPHDRTRTTDCPESAVEQVRKQSFRVIVGDRGDCRAEIPICGHHARLGRIVIWPDGGLSFVESQP